jgi:hypothetical protein
MATKFFDCENCGSHGKIVYKEDDLNSNEVAFCPFCGGDIYEDKELDDEE